ncbi:MAG: hypothetical protein PF482_16345 [Desulfobacteraceae bacterium]|jgi:hypothetical protein|nr:hypothetical protein [Desulfobacteraceae bacterium]
MIVYPDIGYNSFISLDDAVAYFKTRLHSDEFLSQGWNVQEPALITAYRSINELDLTIDPTEAAQIQALKNAQCEQALHEIKEDLDSQNINSFILMGIKTTKSELPRYSQRALAILRPYISAPICQVVR